jgi:hypothetical protein
MSRPIQVADKVRSLKGTGYLAAASISPYVSD